MARLLAAPSFDASLGSYQSILCQGNNEPWLPSPRAPGYPVTVKGFPRPTLSDLAIIIVSAAVALASLGLAANGRGRPILEVKTPKGSFLEPLERDAEYSFEGDLGATVVKVSGGRALVLSSPCANQLCVHSQPIGKPGDWIACLPNRVMLRVRGGSEEAKVDADSW